MVGLALAHTELSGFDAGFSAEELSAQGGVNRFAAEVMRPIGREPLRHNGLHRLARHSL